MRINTQDDTLKKNYLQKYRFLIKEYEKVKAREHPRFRFVKDFYEFHDTDRRSFLKYYNRYKQNGKEEDLLRRVREAITLERTKPGSLKGSLLVEISPEGVYCRVGHDMRSRDGWEKPEATRAEVVLHTTELVRQAGKLVHKGHPITADGVTYFIVAIHGWFESPPISRRQLGSA